MLRQYQCQTAPYGRREKPGRCVPRAATKVVKGLRVRVMRPAKTWFISSYGDAFTIRGMSLFDNEAKKALRPYPWG